ncbi:hypothetical protein M5K25_006918 [Dendrobium thyrsiflorum]|uniref:Uncharacterized protein n=1 Tax=Dendrobium thyrsiflorum TaxID=117978 RepID=A0ABD0VJY3_DENTH
MSRKVIYVVFGHASKPCQRYVDYFGYSICSQVDQNVDQNESLNDQTPETSPNRNFVPEQVQEQLLIQVPLALCTKGSTQD